MSLKDMVVNWWYGEVEDDEHYTPAADRLTYLEPGLKAWAGQWINEGLIQMERIDLPDWGNEPELANKVRAMMEVDDYSGIKQWWYDYLKARCVWAKNYKKKVIENPAAWRRARHCRKRRAA